MAAKKITKWCITFELDHDPGDDIAAEVAGADYIIESIDTFVCPHCGKPWPLSCADQPLSLLNYKREVADGFGAYCCAATRRDCEGA